MTAQATQAAFAAYRTRLDASWAVRQPDGYFGVPPEWRNRNVSGVLVVNQLMPYYVQRAETTLWRHPAPLHQLHDDTGFPGHVLDLREGVLIETKAVG